jgi:nitrite reductase/ring-hydroxylating ferredoxin subunit
VRDRKFKICANREIAEREFRIVPLQYKKQAVTGVLFRFNQSLYAYVNQCVHMQRDLDCEANSIFDESGKLLRCSMHGSVYQPETGVSISTRCSGERLQAIRLKIHKDIIYIDDKRVTAVKSPEKTSHELS